MCENKYKELIDRSLHQASRHLSEENYGRAFANYLVVLRLKKEEETRQEEEEEDDHHHQMHLIVDNFVFALGQWGQELEERGKVQELFDCYEQALELLPTNEHLLINLGAHLLRLDCYKDAATYLKRALTTNPSSVTAREYLDTVFNALVERWHFSMLNCTQRNMAFKNGIRKAVSDGHNVVLDIGSGTGILSMFAVQSGAKRVHACEVSQTMFEIAKQSLSSNGMTDDVHLLNEKSTSLLIPEHLPERVSLIITETFDAGLFGENILETLVHAWDNLLLPVSTKKGEIGGGIVLPKRATLWGFLIESDQILKYSRLLQSSSKLWNIPWKPCISKWSKSDPYTTERLSELRGSYRMMSKPVKILEVDFNDVRQLRRLLEGHEMKFSVSCEADGRLDAVVIYFDLYVTETEFISNGPNDTTCWEQAIFPAVHLSDIICSQGQEVSLDVLCRGCLDVKFSLVSNASTMAHDRNATTLPSIDIVKLNDELFQSTLKMALDDIACNRDCVNVFFISNLPMSVAYACSISNVIYVGCTDETHALLRKLIVENELNTNTKLVTTASNARHNELEWNVVVADIVEPFGLINTEAMNEIALLRASARNLSCFLVIPCKLLCKAVLIESEVLTERNRVVNDDRTLGLSIGQHINSYSVSLQQDIDLNVIQHKKLSNEMTILEMDFMKFESNVAAIPSFLEANKISPIVVTTTGKITAIAFWFQLEFIKQKTISTLDPRCHWNQAAFVLSEDIPVIPGQTLSLNANCNRGHLNISLV